MGRRCPAASSGTGQQSCSSRLSSVVSPASFVVCVHLLRTARSNLPYHAALMNTPVDDGRVRAKAARWRREFGIGKGGGHEGAGLESVAESAPAPDDRLAMAREAMARL